MTTRREFVTRAAAVVGAATLGACRKPGPDSAGPARPAASERRSRLERVGLELYTVRAEMRKDVAATLAAVAQIGYKEVEFAGYFNLPAGEIRALLDRNGLTSPSAHTAIELLERDFAAQAATAGTIGHRWLIVPSLNTRALTDAAAWKGMAARFNELGKRARDAGVRFAFHNHAVEPSPMADGTRPYDILLAETDPALVDFQMDLFWMIRAGGDPLDYFARHPGRFTSVHVKDGTGAPDWKQLDVGSGTIDWKRLLAQHAQAGIEHYYVESDDPGPDPIASVRRSYAYLSTLEF
jgi:sugar phosphate isomerase/epimerase